MAGSVKSRYESLLEHDVVVLLFLTVVALTLGGVGNAAVTSLAGIALCLAGCLRGSLTVDLWVLIPLLVYNGFSMASTYVTYGTIDEGYARVQLIFPVVYLLMACLDEKQRHLLRRLCAVWAGAVAAIGIVQFLYRAMTRGAVRLGGLLGNANALGIFLVMAWFVFLSQSPEEEDAILFDWKRLEPLVLAALGLALSMGSFLSMAVGILLVIVQEKKRSGWRPAFTRACLVLARASAGVGTGVLIYVAARKTALPWLGIIIAAYLLVVAWNWRLLLRFLQERPRAAMAMTGLGVIIALVAVAVRPNAVATFAERLDMMANGLKYLLQDPLLGVGPYQWRLLNLKDSDTYFNVWHIHNSYLHAGVELGLAAMAMLILAAVRHLRKPGGQEEKPSGIAFLVHNLLDTSFFYESLSVFALMTAGRPRDAGTKLNPLCARGLFLGLIGVFCYNLVR